MIPANSESDNNSINVENITKTYSIWKDPKSRLKHPFLRFAKSFFKYGKSRLHKELINYIDCKANTYLAHHRALTNVSFKVTKGETVGILGLNGSGKSTLLQIIVGVLQPTSGTVKSEGRIAALLELGAGFNDEFTGRENAFLNGAILGIDRNEMEKRFDEITKFAEIGEFMDQPVKTYSSGMKLRLAFAVLTQIDPDVLVIDEALAVGDAYFQHKCSQRIRKFKDEGKTLLFVSHSPGDIKSLCERAILLEKGKIIRDGKADEVIDYYNAIIAKKEKDDEIRQLEQTSGRKITRSGNAKAEFVDIHLLNEKMEESRCFACGENANIRLVVRFNESLDNPTYGIMIRDRIGLEVFGTNTYYKKMEEYSVEKDMMIEANFELVLNLGPGSYSITIAVHSGAAHTEENYDWLDNAVVFEVLPNMNNQFIGIAALPYNIQLKQVSKLDHNEASING